MEMSAWSVTGTCLGGLGLFLVGMWLMTDGLKLTAGDALRELLQKWTNSRRRGLITGFSITALVQSSSAVTVATIGFANAGLLTLEQAVWVIFGSNVGTTMTGWIVALVGFKINMEAFALPLVGIGMLIRLTGQKSRRAALGQALVGFGLFFLGIGILKEAFEALGAGINLPGMDQAGPASLLLYVLLGLALTTLMQSSSAAIVITLSAAEGGLIPLSAAAATVIGANLGTTSTALLSVWGATAVAKRVAVSHILFNLITALVAMLIILPMLMLIAFIQDLFNLPPAPATTLALFHTVFNILGVLLMLPLAGHMVRFLARRFVSREEMAGRPAYLDQTILEIPALAVDALLKELERLQQSVIASINNYLSMERLDLEKQDEERNTLEQLINHIADYVANLSRTDLSSQVSETLPEVIRFIQQNAMLMDNLCDATERVAQLDPDRLRDQSLDKLVDFRQSAQQTISLLQKDPAPTDSDLDEQLYKLEDAYTTLRIQILQDGASGTLGMVAVDNLLSQASLTRRVVKQACKVERRLSGITSLLGMESIPEMKVELPDV